MAIKTQINEKWEILLEKFQERPLRERRLIIGAIAVASLIGIILIVESTLPLFQSQSSKLTKLERNVNSLPKLLERFSNLETHRKDIESQFKGSDTNVGINSYLEDLLKVKTGITERYTINKFEPREFGGKFERTQFKIDFSTTNLQQIVNFLKNLKEGSQPLLLSKVKIKKSRVRLSVTIELSSIRPKV